MARKSTAQQAAVAPHGTKPSADWRKSFLDHVRRTGEPETFSGIERLPPPGGSRPYILFRFDVDRKKRPLGDMAPCALCSPFHEKCLEGLCAVWYEDEGVVRIIGPECGLGLDGGDLLAVERKAFDRRQRQERAESFLEINIPKIPAWLEAMRSLQPAAAEAQRLHHKMRHDSTDLVKMLRQVRKPGRVVS